MTRVAFLAALVSLGSVFSQATPPKRIAGVSCDNFKTWQEAQRYFDYDSKQPVPKRSGLNLYRDKDGRACECLPGGPDVGKPNCQAKKP